jgi:hypothetical protein
MSCTSNSSIEERLASEWWDNFAKMDRSEFERTAQDLIGINGRLPNLRKIVAEPLDREGS